MRDRKVPHFILMENLYEIKQILSSLTRDPISRRFYYYVGSFQIIIYTNRIQESAPPNGHDCLTVYSTVDVVLFEYENDNCSESLFINMNNDYRFKNYNPIKY